MTDIPADVQQAATRIADKYLGFDISCQALYADVCAALVADRAAQAERIRRLEDVLDGIYIYANDTLSGRVDGPDDRAWQRSAVVEIRNRARKFARAALGGNADA